MYRYAKKTRVAVSAALAIVAAVSVASSVIGIGLTFGWIKRIQIVPLLLSAGLPWIIGWMLITFVFGRIYCSSVCPLGTLQDCISRVSRSALKNRGYFYSRPLWSVRWLFFFAMICAIGWASMTLTLALDPYSGFHRIVDGVVLPVFSLGALSVNLAMAVGALATLIVVMFFSAYKGRLLCNTICPVGTGLGLLSISPVFRMDINTDKCIGCNRCVEVCKASCIDPSAHTVDTTRCVVCFNCTAVCSNNAITYTCNRHRLKTPMLMENQR